MDLGHLSPDAYPKAFNLGQFSSPHVTNPPTISHADIYITSRPTLSRRRFSPVDLRYQPPVAYSVTYPKRFISLTDSFPVTFSLKSGFDSPGELYAGHLYGNRLRDSFVGSRTPQRQRQGAITEYYEIATGDDQNIYFLYWDELIQERPKLQPKRNVTFWLLKLYNRWFDTIHEMFCLLKLFVEIRVSNYLVPHFS